MGETGRQRAKGQHPGAVAAGQGGELPPRRPGQEGQREPATRPDSPAVLHTRALGNQTEGSRPAAVLPREVTPRGRTGPETGPAVQADGTNAPPSLQTRAPPPDPLSRAGEGGSSCPFPTSQNLNAG